MFASWRLYIHPWVSIFTCEYIHPWVRIFTREYIHPGAEYIHPQVNICTRGWIYSFLGWIYSPAGKYIRPGVDISARAWIYSFEAAYIGQWKYPSPSECGKRFGCCVCLGNSSFRGSEQGVSPSQKDGDPKLKCKFMASTSLLGWRVSVRVIHHVQAPWAIILQTRSRQMCAARLALVSTSLQKYAWIFMDIRHIYIHIHELNAPIIIFIITIFSHVRGQGLVVEYVHISVDIRARWQKCIYVHIRAYMHITSHTRICVHTCIYMHICICMHIRAYKYVRTRGTCAQAQTQMQKLKLPWACVWAWMASGPGGWFSSPLAPLASVTFGLVVKEYKSIDVLILIRRCMNVSQKLWF